MGREQRVSVLPEVLERLVAVDQEAPEQLVAVDPELTILGHAVLETLNVTPSLSAQDILPEEGVDGFDEVLVTAIPAGSARTPDTRINVDLKMDIEGKRVIVIAQGSESERITPVVTPGWVQSGEAGSVDVSAYGEMELPLAKVQDKIVLEERPQTIVTAPGWVSENVEIPGIDSRYVGSDVPQRSSSDLTVNGRTVSAPAGYYASAASASVAQGTAGTPTASKGAVSNHGVDITPSVSNTTGYISGGTINGSPVHVDASELVSGSETKTENGTYDVTNLAQVVVDVPSGGGGELPAAYRRVLGFKCNNNAMWEIAGFHLKGSDTVRISFSVEAACNIFGCYQGGSADDNYDIYASLSAGSKYLRYGSGTYLSYFSPSNLGKRFDVVLTPTGSSGMPNDSTWTAQTFTSDNNLIIGSTTIGGSSSKLQGNLYGEVVVDGRLNLIPCERIADGVLGYYDTYSETFYPPYTGYTGAVSLGYADLKDATLIDPLQLAAGIIGYGPDGRVVGSLNLNGNFEFVSTLYEDVIDLDDTDYPDWTPSTTAATVLTSSNVATFSADMDNYVYYIMWEICTTFEFVEDATLKAMPITEVALLPQAIVRRSSSLVNINAHNNNQNYCLTDTASTMLIYYTTGGTATYVANNTYGVYPTAVAATFSSSTGKSPTVTVKSPTMSARCNSSYFATGRKAEVDTANTKIHRRCKLYRLGIDKFGRQWEYDQMVDYYNAKRTQ